MPPKKNPGARRRGTTLSLNEFLRHDDDSNPTDPTCDPNPPMATNGSSRSRNDQPSNRSCNNARRNVGKLSPSAVGPHRSNPFNPTDTKPPMATYGSNRSRNSAHQYNDQTSIAAVGSNRSGNKSRRNGDRPSASAVGSNRSRRESNPPNPTDTNPQSHQFGGPAGSNGSDNRTLQNYENPKMPNTAELGYNQLFRPGVQLTQIFGYTIAANPDQLLNSPTPEPTDTDPPMAANGASFSSINTPQNDAPPETSADGNENLSNVGDDDILRQRFSHAIVPQLLAAHE
ncbi:sporozoite surface protein 2-like isoform X3 [Drosophila miranda]|uniref:sporozoite surface protein 2-like isoform X3 n=1 Tax=Drosophila miranda TaxID=7229 RepID=UPI00143F817F|nr:sporozoite surface protein 2-like isoform X3 [Drosophila miranda]